MFDSTLPPTITGTVVLRPTNQPAKPGKKICILVGVIEVPEDFHMQGESQAVVIGQSLGDTSSLMISGKGTLLSEIPEAPRGSTVDKLLFSSIWRV